jgi:hypothetical protein
VYRSCSEIQECECFATAFVNVRLGVNSHTASLHLPAGKKVALSELHFRNMLQRLLCRLLITSEMNMWKTLAVA